MDAKLNEDKPAINSTPLTPDGHEILEVMKLGYQSTTDTIGHVGGAYSRFLLQGILGLVFFFSSGLVLGEDRKAWMIFMVIPYLSMLILAIENYSRTVLWFHNRYQYLLQERINAFVGRDVMLFGKYYRPMAFFSKSEIVLVNTYRALMPFVIFIATNAYSIIKVNNIKSQLFRSRLLMDYYVPITCALLIAMTLIWLFYFIKMVGRYTIFIKNKANEVDGLSLSKNESEGEQPR